MNNKALYYPIEFEFPARFHGEHAQSTENAAQKRYFYFTGTVRHLKGALFISFSLYKSMEDCKDRYRNKIIYFFVQFAQNLLQTSITQRSFVTFRVTFSWSLLEADGFSGSRRQKRRILQVRL